MKNSKFLILALTLVMGGNLAEAKRQSVRVGKPKQEPVAAPVAPAAAPSEAPKVSDLEAKVSAVKLSKEESFKALSDGLRRAKAEAEARKKGYEGELSKVSPLSLAQGTVQNLESEAKIASTKQVFETKKKALVDAISAQPVKDPVTGTVEYRLNPATIWAVRNALEDIKSLPYSERKNLRDVFVDLRGQIKDQVDAGNLWELRPLQAELNGILAVIDDARNIAEETKRLEELAKIQADGGKLTREQIQEKINAEIRLIAEFDAEMSQLSSIKSSLDAARKCQAGVDSLRIESVMRFAFSFPSADYTAASDELSLKLEEDVSLATKIAALEHMRNPSKEQTKELGIMRNRRIELAKEIPALQEKQSEAVRQLAAINVILSELGLQECEFASEKVDSGKVPAEAAPETDSSLDLGSQAKKANG